MIYRFSLVMLALGTMLPAEDRPCLTFNDKLPALAPLTAKEIVSSMRLSTRGDAASTRPQVRPEDERGFRTRPSARMPVIEPNPAFHYTMTVKTPDPRINYKMLQRETEQRGRD